MDAKVRRIRGLHLVAAAAILITLVSIAYSLLPMRAADVLPPPEPVPHKSSSVLLLSVPSGDPTPASAAGIEAASGGRGAKLAAILAPRSWSDALREASAPLQGDGLDHERRSVWVQVHDLCRLDLAIQRGASRHVQRGMATPEGRQSLAMVRDVAAVYCEGFDPAMVEAVRMPFLEPVRPAVDPETDLADVLAATDSSVWYGNAAVAHLDRPVLQSWEDLAGISAYAPAIQRRIRRVATLEAWCAIFSMGCHPGGLVMIAECSFDHRCRPGATAPQIMAERFGLDARQQALAIGLGQAMAADYGRRRSPRGG